MWSLSYEGTNQVTWISLAAGVISQDLVLSEPGVFDWLTHVQASPLTYLAVLGACALDAILPIVPSEAVVIAASILATRGELSIWVIALAAAAGGFLGDTGSYGLGRTAGALAVEAARRLRRRGARAGGRGALGGQSEQ
jgi:membrane protein YqaA with SNARE-associated domain